jgi:phosphoglycerate dehydrogenase-like enzyme
LRRLCFEFKTLVNEKEWKDEARPFSMSLFDKKVGLLGLGSIARNLHSLIKPYTQDVSAYDPYAPDSIFEELGIQRAESPEALFSKVDIISMHTPKTKETDNLVNKSLLDLLPDYGVIVNTARGNALNEKDLYEQHKKGRLFSGLDVFAVEPLPADSPLRTTSRCILTGHQAGPTQDVYPDMGRRGLENIKRFANSEPLIQEITPEILGRMT